MIFKRQSESSWFLIVFLCITIVFLNGVFAQKSPHAHPPLLQRFWDIGCEFSGVVTRVRRSTDNPLLEEPNFEDPDELFNYLYPLANVNLPGNQEGNDASDQESSRSSFPSGTHSLSSWLEDLLQLWHSECHHRREKRSSERRANRQANNDGRLRRKEYAWVVAKKATLDGRNSSLANSMRRQSYDDGYGSGYPLRSQTILEDVEDKEEDKVEDIGKDKDKEKEKDKLAALAGLAGQGVAAAAGLIPEKPAVASNVPTMADNKQEDIFFTQYGGDIEYFFPLLSFGIPFDGEITLLGFHGFRGIFPY